MNPAAYIKERETEAVRLRDRAAVFANIGHPAAHDADRAAHWEEAAVGMLRYFLWPHLSDEDRRALEVAA